MSGSTGSSLTPQGREAAEHDSASAAAATPTPVICGSIREQQSPSFSPCVYVCVCPSVPRPSHLKHVAASGKSNLHHPEIWRRHREFLITACPPLLIAPVVGFPLMTMHLNCHCCFAPGMCIYVCNSYELPSFLEMVSYLLLVFCILNYVPIQELCSSPHKCQSGLISFPWQIPVIPSRMISKSCCDLPLAVGCSPGPSGSWCLIKDTSLSVSLWLSYGKRGNRFTFCFHPLLNNMLYI